MRLQFRQREVRAQKKPALSFWSWVDSNPAPPSCQANAVPLGHRSLSHDFSREAYLDEISVLRAPCASREKRDISVCLFVCLFVLRLQGMSSKLTEI